MTYSITNIARFASAELTLSGLTVLSGTNGSGTTTIAKALYAAVKSEIALSQHCNEEKVELLARIAALLAAMYAQDHAAVPIDGALKERIIHLERLCDHISSGDGDLRPALALCLQLMEEEPIQEFLSHDGHFADDLAKMIEALKRPLSVEDSPATRTLAERAFRAEFGDQLANLAHQGEISHVLCGASGFSFSEGVCTSARIAEPRFRNVIYLDDLPVIEAHVAEGEGGDAASSRPLFSVGDDHRRDLLAMLHAITQETKNEVSKDLLEEAGEAPSKILGGLLGGRLEYRSEREGFVYREEERDIALSNMGGGSKVLALLELLLRSGCIHGSTCLIIDEPEAHLHPQWQIQMAELLVSLAKDTKAKILISTHSPYVVEAVRVYSQIAGMEEQTGFYHALKTGVFSSTLRDVSDDISPIYAELAEPYRTLDAVYDNAGDLGHGE